MNHIVPFSTGLSSALTVERVLARYGRASVEIVFLDTTIEDDDNYRFLDDMRRRWDMPITVLREGRDPYTVSRAEHVIPNQKLAPCTFRLKIEPFTDYLKTKPDQDLTIHIGYDFTEVHRCAATTKNYSALGWQVDYPLLWKPYEYRKYPDIARHEWGVEPPRMYALGYSHANCGGRCVKQGIGDWLRTLANFPDRYAESEAWEAAMRQNETNANYAILRDQSGGQVRALTLRELRERHADRLELPLFNTGLVCINCGPGELA